MDPEHSSSMAHVAGDNATPHAASATHLLLQSAPPPSSDEQPQHHQEEEEEEARELPANQGISDDGTAAYYRMIMLLELERQQSDHQIFPDVNHLTEEHRWELFHQMSETMGFQHAASVIARLRQWSAAAGELGAVVVVVAASAAAVAGLEKQTFHAGTGDGGGVTECAICLNDFEDGEEVSVMPCFHGHGFHSDCITTWLGRSNMCPLCRHQLPTAAVDGE